ncbi:MAG TPA: hypothetical protein DDW79_04700 [Anaerolineae bacterium]|nr:hypothetical protein [Anaerolineae bacterium]
MLQLWQTGSIRLDDLPLLWKTVTVRRIPMCGGNLVRMLIPLTSNPVEQVARTHNTRTDSSEPSCSNCGTATSPEFVWCPKCGASLNAHPCAYCGQTISPGEQTCRFCGASANKR